VSLRASMYDPYDSYDATDDVGDRDRCDIDECVGDGKWRGDDGGGMVLAMISYVP
jgi:hypothetical protein